MCCIGIYNILPFRIGRCSILSELGSPFNKTYTQFSCCWPFCLYLQLLLPHISIEQRSHPNSIHLLQLVKAKQLYNCARTFYRYLIQKIVPPLSLLSSAPPTKINAEIEPPSLPTHTCAQKYNIFGRLARDICFYYYELSMSYMTFESNWMIGKLRLSICT